MLRLAICDDDADELSKMVCLIEEYRTGSCVKYDYTVFHNGIELMAVLEKGEQFDIYCLDIIMPGFTGIALAKEIRTLDKNAQILFFTSSTDFALESYSVKAVNYVTKPVTREKLFNALTDVLELTENRQESSVVVKSSEGLQKILLSNLVFVEAMRKRVVYHVVSGRTIECTDQFSIVCEHLLKEGCFVKPHRSYLVNMN